MDCDQVKDRPVGVTRMGEKLIQGDRPIVEYRRRRQELLDEVARPSMPDQAHLPGDGVPNLLGVWFNEPEQVRDSAAARLLPQVSE